MYETQLTRIIKRLILMGLISAGTPALALQQSDGLYQWDFLSGLAWPLGYNQNTGKPDNLTWSYPDYPSEFFDRINNALPEQYVNEAFLTDDAGANIHLVEDGEVFITFVHEGAGYKNSFGYFTFDKNNPPATPAEINEIIVFPNLSYPHMSNGHRLSIGRFAAGTSIGFFIAANGFSYYDGVKTSAVPYYYSLKHLNPDPPALRQHNVLLYDDAVSEVIIGFEDLPRSWGDNDFNDAIFSVRATPETAIDSSELVAVPDVNDSDADGVVDAEDEFPDDYNRAYSTYYPSASGWVSLAYEDGWPSVGDYDMNDLVVRERFQVTYSASDEITGFVIQGYIDARGASYHNGFALRLLGKSPSLMASARLTIDGREYNKTPEADQSDLVLSLWRDSHVHTQTGESGACSHFNTRKTCTQFAPVAFSLDVSFSSPPETLRHADLDFFIYRTDNRAREIHMADFPPTDLFDQSQFGRFDDTSVPAAGRYFRNAQNLPWALQIPTAWRHPREYIDIVWAYPDYENWVESAGVEANDWFSTSERDTHYY